ncbi:MAG: hypothetical protein FWE70_03225, partial [Oscillospiraceae bacterium]|nr:hypothetical protein [Oscillospiraceae bacterium]
MGKFRPIDMNDPTIIQSIADERTHTAITLYNNAVVSLAQGNDDIAVIALRKSVGLCPDFHDAMILLGVCYMGAGEGRRAADLFEAVVESDGENELARSYQEDAAMS